MSDPLLQETSLTDTSTSQNFHLKFNDKQFGQTTGTTGYLCRAALQAAMIWYWQCLVEIYLRSLKNWLNKLWSPARGITFCKLNYQTSDSPVKFIQLYEELILIYCTGDWLITGHYVLCVTKGARFKDSARFRSAYKIWGARLPQLDFVLTCKRFIISLKAHESAISCKARLNLWAWPW